MPITKGGMEGRSGSVETELIRTIINQVNKNKDALAKYHKVTLKEKFNFKFYKYQNKFTVSKGDNEISAYNLGQFLGGVVDDTVKKWKRTLDDKGFTLGEDRAHSNLMFRRIRSTVLRLFHGKGKMVQQGRVLIERAIEAYINKYLSEMDYITELCFLLDDCAIWENIPHSKEEAHSETSFEQKLSGRTYLQSLRYSSNSIKEFEEISKYFRLTTNLLNIKETDFKFESKEKYEEFREKSINIVFKELIKKGTIDDDVDGFDVQYQAFVYTLSALTKARFNKYKDNPQEMESLFKTQKNPNMLYTLTELSEELGRRQTLGEYFKYNRFISPEKVQRIKSILLKNKNYAREECSLAIDKMDEVPKQRSKNRPSYVGRLGHPILENFFRKVWLGKNVDSSHEDRFRYPKSSHRIDSKVDIYSQPHFINSVNLASVDKLKDINLKNFRELFVDYNIPSLSKIAKTLKKASPSKHYLGEGRLMFVPFYGSYSDNVFPMIEKRLESFNYDYKENAYFIDLMDFATFVGLNNDQLQKLEYINTLIKISMGTNRFSDWALSKLEGLADEAIFELELSKSNLNNNNP